MSAPVISYLRLSTMKFLEMKATEVDIAEIDTDHSITQPGIAIWEVLLYKKKLKYCFLSKQKHTITIDT